MPDEPFFNACIARSVGKDESLKSVSALKAQDTEWSKLWDQRVWDETQHNNFHAVRYEAQNQGKEIHLGKLFGICVEKVQNYRMKTRERK